ncbi:MAG: T9SS type A sorting domain-containing protein, partial [Bacteroidales bacterium]|nr:T9SS type A sorting domain-containing protein [Bacteroidales bacterium]
NLYFGKTYYWRARAVSSALNDTSAYSPVRTFTTASYPTLYSPSDVANLENSVRVELVWNRLSGATGYEIEIDTASSFDSPVYSLYDSFTYSGTSGKPYKVIEPLLYGTTYYWRVRATNDIDTSDWSQVRRFTTSACPDWYSPNTASELENSAYASLQWYEIKGTTDYEVEIDTVNTFDSPLYSMYDSFSYHATSQLPCVNVSPLLFGTTYYWRVRAINAIDTSQWSQICRFTTSACPTLYSPNNGITLQDASYVYLVWLRMSGTTGFEVEVDISNTFDSPYDSIYEPSSASYSNNLGGWNVRVSPLLSGTTYYWRVRALNDIDTSDWSYIRRFTTAYQLTTAPTLVSPANGSTEIAPSGVELVWNEIDNVTGYRYQVATDNAFASIVRNGTTAGTNATCNLMYGTTYYWRVQGYNASGNSVWSAVWNFSTQDCQQPTGETSVTACSSYLWHGTNYTESGNYTITVPQSNGCDSVLTLHLTINHPQAENIEVTACSSYEWDGQTYTESGTYDKTFTASNGCDSVVTLHLTINHPQTGLVEVTACDSYEWNGETYTESGTYDKTFTASNGCDSVVTLHLTINESPTRDFTAVACGSYLWNNQTYTESGNYEQTISSDSGCDSIVTLHLTINHPQTESVEASACDSYEWNGETYTESGSYDKTFTASNGCDSVVTLHLTINHPQAEQVEVTACSSYEWDGQTYTESGTYDKTFTASNGCDSVVTLHLTINHPQTGLVEVTACDSYEWDGDTYTESGTYDKTFTASNGCDSIVTLHLTINHPQTGLAEATACDSYEWNGETYTESGTYEKTFTASNGCDSVVTLQLTINESVQYSFTETATSPYIWNGTEYTETGDYTQNFTAENGCDSIVTLHLNILSGISDIDNSAITIFPNPTSGILNITSTETISEIEIVNALGQVVYRAEVNTDNAVCDVEELTAGVYFVKIYGNPRTSTGSASGIVQKFIKE